ncbi:MULTISPECIES: ABC transporter substrate-binding protein [Megasphaera]|uniref:Receptor family ligand-binding protein n=1 Tax=Megasphaera vaginalis (ex Srinivasan et al. 2021) TaxID=1111454 RepID=U7UIC1_9FIRM|nr:MULTISPECIES: ABC transporter substrate-binding protein [Megasphaera]ERT59147.1 receptor family ligand-binding protein [Megasphaera vaginalis (ex Srinivasan et al. 2021)]
MRSALAAVLLSLALLCSSCGLTEPNEIRIGINMNLNENDPLSDRAAEQGIELAKDVINEEGGILNKPIQLISMNNHGSPEKAAAAMDALAERHVCAVIGPNRSPAALAVITRAEALKLPVISPAGTHPDITVNSELHQVYPHMFRATFINSVQARAIAEHAFSHLKKRRAAIVSDSTDPYSLDLAKFFEKSFTAHGGTVTAHIDLAAANAADRAVAAAAMSDTVYMPLYITKAVPLIAAIRRHDKETVILGADDWQALSTAPQLREADLNRVFYTDHYANDVNDAVSETFAERFYEKYGELPSAKAALSYDSLLLLANAMRSGNSSSDTAIIQGLEHTRDFIGATGKIGFDSNHDAIKDVCIMTFWQKQPVLTEHHHLLGW